MNTAIKNITDIKRRLAAPLPKGERLVARTVRPTSDTEGFVIVETSSSTSPTFFEIFHYSPAKTHVSMSPSPINKHAHTARVTPSAEIALELRSQPFHNLDLAKGVIQYAS